MARGGVCPVCELPHDASPEPSPTGSARAVPGELPGEGGDTLVGRLWQSGQLAVTLALLCFLLALFLPLARELPFASGPVSVRPWDLLMNNLPMIHGRPTDWVLPGAAIFLASLLYSRRTGSAMLASRPMVLVVSLLPVFSVVMPFLAFKKRGLTPGVGPAAVLVAFGMILGVVGALRFGRGVPDRRPPSHDDDD